MSLCRECGSPARATLIVDWSGNLRYMAAHRTDIPRSLMLPFSSMQSSPVHLSICYLQFFISRNVTEILRLVQAFRHSDLTGHVRKNPI